MLKLLTLVLGSAVCLAGCGGSDTRETPGAFALAVAATRAPTADTATAVRERVEALRRGGRAGGGFEPGWKPHPSSAVDPGPRAGTADAGLPFANLTPPQLTAFNAGREDFIGAEAVADCLGPTMNLDSCGGCHSHPTVGGTSPPVNPQVAFATLPGATNKLPLFITANGPVREARFVLNIDGSLDGGVYALFTIAGRSDAAGCTPAGPPICVAPSSSITATARRPAA